ncbi:MAG: hypothetical protein JSW33_01380 [bacterium]|nr:MAG: hypothetical protein JSW33_01380 [bacterium]
MKRAVLFLATILIVLLAGLLLTSFQASKKDKPQSSDITVPLPASLDKLFPPQAEQPVFLFKMLGMATPFTGIIVDLFENDLENAKDNFEKFKANYTELSKLVPEWEKYFPIEPVDKLGRTLISGDPAQVMPAYEQVGKVCSNCHNMNMPRVQYKYHWGDFQAITIEDPLTRQVVSFQQFMQFLDVSYTGISVNMNQGQIDNARKQLQGFRARFEAMEETCMNCHDTERLYYVDETVEAMIDELEEALNASPVDPKKVGMISQGIGMENCFKCHLVHVPAAVAQMISVK